MMITIKENQLQVLAINRLDVDIVSRSVCVYKYTCDINEDFPSYLA